MTLPFAPPNPPAEPPYSPPFPPAGPYSFVALPASTPPPVEPDRPHRRRGRAVSLVLLACIASAGVAFAVSRATDDNTSSTKQAAPTTAPSKTTPTTVVAADSSTGGASATIAPAKTTSGPSTASVSTLDVGKIVSQISPSVVKVSVDISNAAGSGEGVGTGIVLTADGQIITNAHVVADATKVRVVLSGQSEPVVATVVGVDVGNDLALIKIDGKDLPVMQIADSGAVKVGDPVVAMGYALDLAGDPSVTAGIISALNRSMVTDKGALNGLLQTDAAISSGNSGGPLVNSSGELIGINTAVATGGSSNTATNIGFAIATKEINQILDKLRAGEGTTGSNQRVEGYLGIGVQDRTDGGRGAIVSQVQAASPAAKAGLQKGDVVTSVNGQAINGQGSLIAAIRDAAPGDKVTIDYERDGKQLTATVTLDSRPAS